MLETDVLNVTPPLSPSYKGRPAVYTGCVLCQICFTGRLKKNVKREKLEKYLVLNISKKQHYTGKNCSYEYKRVHALGDWEKGEEIAHKACNEHSLRKVFLFQKRKKLQL